MLLWTVKKSVACNFFRPKKDCGINPSTSKKSVPIVNLINRCSFSLSHVCPSVAEECMISEKNVYTERYPVVYLTQCFKICTYWYIVSLFAQACEVLHSRFYFELPNSLIKHTYMKYTFICWFHVIDFKLQFCNYFIFFSSDVISLFSSLFEFLFCRSYICKLWIRIFFYRNGKHWRIVNFSLNDDIQTWKIAKHN